MRRYTESYWRSVRSQPLTPEQRTAQALLSVLAAAQFFISPELVNLLRRRTPLLVIEQIRPLLHVLVPTNDLKLIDRFGENSLVIKSRFFRMVSHLPAPYTAAKLPEVATPTEVLALFSTMREE